jgi:triosephosphate isomerase
LYLATFLVKIAAVFRVEELMRRSLVAGNWKMNGSRATIESLLANVAAGLSNQAVDIVVCPSHVYIELAVNNCSDTPINVGGQDCSHVVSGAYTGEVSPEMLSDLGCRWVILGHSERRQYHAEVGSLIAAKLGAAIDSGLSPILCVGETREQRESGEAKAVVAEQLNAVLHDRENVSDLVVAYEPVWAIGTGLTASPEQAQDMHAYIRECLRKVAAIDAEKTRILYGGSVKGDNAEQLFSQPDIDGALVGGAALNAQDFIAIINAAATQSLASITV